MAAAQSVALVGFGTVGQAVARLIADGNSGLHLHVICTRRAAERRADWVSPDVVWTDRFDALLSMPVDIVIELVGGVEPAEQWIRRALAAGKSVVTANKQVIARSGADLAELARAHGCQIRFEAAVAGVVPVVGALQQGLAADRVVRIQGVLNGTCNFVLSRMERGFNDLESAVDQAQRRGFAEADPSADLNGDDAVAKLAILASIGFKRRLDPSDIARKAITDVVPRDFLAAREIGCTIRQVAWAEQLGDEGQVRAVVMPALVPLSSTIGRADGAENVVSVTGRSGGEITMTGAGAGGEATAVAVVSDALSVTGGICPRPFAPLRVRPEDVVSDYDAPHYTRIVASRPAATTPELTAILARNGIEAHPIATGCRPADEAAALGVVSKRSSAGRLLSALDEARRMIPGFERAASFPILNADPATSLNFASRPLAL